MSIFIFVATICIVPAVHASNAWQMMRANCTAADVPVICEGLVGKAPHPCDATMFVKCMNGSGVIKACNKGQVFNVKKEVPGCTRKAPTVPSVNVAFVDTTTTTVARFSVTSANKPDAVDICASLQAVVKNKEVGTIASSCAFTPKAVNGTYMLILKEQYANPEALMAHLMNTGALSGAMFQIATQLSFDIITTAAGITALEPMLGPFGAVFYETTPSALIKLGS